MEKLASGRLLIPITYSCNLVTANPNIQNDESRIQTPISTTFFDLWKIKNLWYKKKKLDSLSQKFTTWMQ